MHLTACLHSQPCPRQPIKGIAGEIIESARPDVSQRSRFRIAAIFDLTFKSQAAAQSGHSRRTQGDVRRRAKSGAVFTRFVGRSEEHTSELQSLMRISYAVFCLKKKKQTTTPRTSTS